MFPPKHRSTPSVCFSGPAMRSRAHRRALLLGGSALCGVAAVFVGVATRAANILPTQGATNLAVRTPAGSLNAKTLVGGVVTPGTITYASSGVAATVALSAPRTLIDWTTFEVGPGNALTFNFVNNSDIVLNRVAGGTISVDPGGAVNRTASAGGAYLGGNLWFIAPNGVFLHGTVTASGVLATTNAALADANLLSDNITTLKAELAAGGSLFDLEGTVTATDASIDASGNLILNGDVNTGPAGTVALVSTGAITQTAGAITATSLTGSSVGATALTDANLFDTLAGFANPGGERRYRRRPAHRPDCDRSSDRGGREHAEPDHHRRPLDHRGQPDPQRRRPEPLLRNCAGHQRAGDRGGRDRGSSLGYNSDSPASSLSFGNGALADLRPTRDGTPATSSQGRDPDDQRSALHPALQARLARLDRTGHRAGRYRRDRRQQRRRRRRGRLRPRRQCRRDRDPRVASVHRPAGGGRRQRLQRRLQRPRPHHHQPHHQRRQRRRRRPVWPERRRHQQCWPGRRLADSERRSRRRRRVGVRRRADRVQYRLDRRRLRRRVRDGHRRRRLRRGRRGRRPGGREHRRHHAVLRHRASRQHGRRRGDRVSRRSGGNHQRRLPHQRLRHRFGDRATRQPCGRPCRLQQFGHHPGLRHRERVRHQRHRRRPGRLQRHGRHGLRRGVRRRHEGPGTRHQPEQQPRWRERRVHDDGTAPERRTAQRLRPHRMERRDGRAVSLSHRLLSERRPGGVGHGRRPGRKRGVRHRPDRRRDRYRGGERRGRQELLHHRARRDPHQRREPPGLFRRCAVLRRHALAGHRSDDSARVQCLRARADGSDLGDDALDRPNPGAGPGPGAGGGGLQHRGPERHHRRGGPRPAGDGTELHDRSARDRKYVRRADGARRAADRGRADRNHQRRGTRPAVGRRADDRRAGLAQRGGPDRHHL